MLLKGGVSRHGWIWIRPISKRRYGGFRPRMKSPCPSMSSWWWTSIRGNVRVRRLGTVPCERGSLYKPVNKGASMLKGMRDFQVPTKVEVDKESLTATYGRFAAEPFERGFGTTVGNSLRRVLLSSLSGAAVVSVKIEGVLHEFSTIPGITEDVTDIILNIKKIRFKLHTDKAKALRLRKKGPGVAKAGDIDRDADIEILTPDLHLATLDKGATLDMELVVKRGRGYVPADRNKEEGMPIGVIPVDAIYSPVTRVNYLVENARVGRMTDYDKVILEIWTDGSISPEDAMSAAALIVRGHLDIFINVKDMEETITQPAAQEAITEINKNLLRSVNELELSVRAANCLKNANIRTIADLVQKTEADMLRTKNFGKKSLNEIKEILTEMGLSLGMKLDHLPQGGSSDRREE